MSAEPATESHSDTRGARGVEVSVVCPFYNERQIIAYAMEKMLESLETFHRTWELIVVNDGSTDDSAEIVRRRFGNDPRVRLLSYPVNRGRGHALRTGINNARGDLIVTTEIDLSWGEDIVQRLVAAFDENPKLDMVVASPNLPGGGYRNVPAGRVWISRLGNMIIRTSVSNALTMNTGMTRGYRREAILSLPLEEDGKEFHLEAMLKARAFNFRVAEIPATLTWLEHKQSAGPKRKSSSKIPKLIASHTLFSIFANPVRYGWAFSILCGVLSLGFLVAGVVRWWYGWVSVYMLIVSLLFALLGLSGFAFGVLVQQNSMILKELWKVRSRQQANNPSARGLSPLETEDETPVGATHEEQD